MTITLTPAAEKLTSYVLRADGTVGAGFRLAVTADGCSGLSADIGVAPAAQPGQQGVERNGLKLLLNAESQLMLGFVTIDLTDTSAQTGLISPEAGMLLQQHRKGCPLEEESCQ
ncbi:iron-sulfur cluster assembly accessory protein [Bradyrhizobium sp. SRL28]|uniref:HesB/IscA family protein n=1 Tax=Bradyrhizobium sp. SRL28 TaxID=2836178 RepID=UPI00201BD134|nr:iron-sulfur cluster biosynthesis family protein [Bradyrhizobium sp. SRL28]